MQPRPSRPASTSLAGTLSLIVTTGAMGQGHGPVFGLSTPTIGRGGWSLDFTAMGRNTTTGALAMLRPMLSYGLTEDVQLSLVPPSRRGRGLAVRDHGVRRGRLPVPVAARCIGRHARRRGRAGHRVRIAYAVCMGRGPVPALLAIRGPAGIQRGRPRHVQPGRGVPPAALSTRILQLGSECGRSHGGAVAPGLRWRDGLLDERAGRAERGPRASYVVHASVTETPRRGARGQEPS